MKTNEVFIIVFYYEDNFKESLFLKEGEKNLKRFLLGEDLITGEENLEQMIDVLKNFFEVKRSKRINQILVKEERRYEFESIPIKKNDNKIS